MDSLQQIKRRGEPLLGEAIMNDEQLLDELIEVVALFRPGRTMCEPVKFRRQNGREVHITEIGLHHPTVHGARTTHIFDVTDGGADYRLEFDSERLTWHLTREADRSYA